MTHARTANIARKTRETDIAVVELFNPTYDLNTEQVTYDVEVLDKGGVGELRIKYATLEQLDELCRRLTARV